MNAKVLAYTPGEPAGIGPDLAILLAQDNHPYCIVCICDPRLLQQRAQELGYKINIKPFDGNICKPNEIQIIDCKLKAKVETGKLNSANSHYVIECLKKATQGCLAGQFHAMVTGPVNKHIISQAGHTFSGHTEFIAKLCDIEKPVMMLANEKVKVALVTTHLPLKEVSENITFDNVYNTIKIVHDTFKNNYAISQPKLIVCGLNPHCGENGLLGDEEIKIIMPAIDKLKQQGITNCDLLPADTAFSNDNLKSTDVFIAMYHDQGLPVVKTLGFGRTVNITLGLPIIRTSVDHGTALDLAGTGKINCNSLIQAFKQAELMTVNKA